MYFTLSLTSPTSRLAVAPFLKCPEVVQGTVLVPSKRYSKNTTKVCTIKAY